MANLIPEELNALIQQYLTDGVLTDKERQVILNKAEKMGLDRDEIDLYLDAEVQKIEIANSGSNREDFHGKVRLCPNCGAPVEPGLAKCSACGYAFTDIAANRIISDLSEQLNEARNKYEGERLVSVISSAIGGLPVPNTKEDMLELLTYLKIGLKNRSFGSDDDLGSSIERSIISKLEECMERLQLSFPNDNYVNQRVLETRKTIEEFEEAQTTSAKWLIGCVIVLVVLFIALFILSFIGAI